MSRKRAVQGNARRGMRRIEGAAGSPAPRDPLHEGRDPFFSTLLASWAAHRGPRSRSGGCRISSRTRALPSQQPPCGARGSRETDRARSARARWHQLSASVLQGARSSGPAGGRDPPGRRSSLPACVANCDRPHHLSVLGIRWSSLSCRARAKTPGALARCPPRKAQVSVAHPPCHGIEATQCPVLRYLSGVEYAAERSPRQPRRRRKSLTPREGSSNGGVGHWAQGR